MKIIVRLGIEPDQKEIFTGEGLEAIRLGSDAYPILVVKDTKKNVTLAEFTNWVCWVRNEE